MHHGQSRSYRRARRSVKGVTLPFLHEKKNTDGQKSARHRAARFFRLIPNLIPQQDNLNLKRIDFSGNRVYNTVENPKKEGRKICYEKNNLRADAPLTRDAIKRGVSPFIAFYRLPAPASSLSTARHTARRQKRNPKPSV